jgi:formylglycine-generating enzyme required for sulfatase activity
LARAEGIAPDGVAWIPGGAFTMGVGEAAHTVHVDGFAMAKHMTTNADYKAFVEATGHSPPPRHGKGGAIPAGKDNHPVLWVCWRDAMRDCAWMIEKTGREVTLPTEAQCEKAARGPKGFLLPWGNGANPNNLNYNGVCARRFGLPVSADGRVTGWMELIRSAEYKALVEAGGATSAVGAYPAGRSHWGCFDMAGNAWEWCQDWYSSQYFRLPGANSNPAVPTHAEAEEAHRAGARGKVKVIRRGSWRAHLSSARTIYREETRSPDVGRHSAGLRVIVKA